MFDYRGPSFARNLIKPFLMSQNFKRRVAQWYRAKRTKSIFARKESSKTRFGAPVYYLCSSSHFLNKTNLEQYLF